MELELEGYTYFCHNHDEGHHELKLGIIPSVKTSLSTNRSKAVWFNTLCVYTYTRGPQTKNMLMCTAKTLLQGWIPENRQLRTKGKELIMKSWGVCLVWQLCFKLDVHQMRQATADLDFKQYICNLWFKWIHFTLVG